MTRPTIRMGLAAATVATMGFAPAAEAERAAAGELLFSTLLGMPPAPATTPAPATPRAGIELPQTHPDTASQRPAAQRPSNTLFGMPGLIDMPSAEAFADGDIHLSLGSFAGISRGALSFQITPRLTGAFRYSRFGGLNFGGFEDYFDRAFDLHYQILDEGPGLLGRPALAVGLRDFAGTGIDASEYIVASKTFALDGGDGMAGRAGRLTVTGGLGWGRMGTDGAVGSPFGTDRPSFVGGSTGGEFSVDQWFRGPAAPFAGLEWRPGRDWKKWRVKVEYSSDAYALESASRGLFERASPVNFGVEYQASDSARFGLYSLYGTEIGFMATLALNPRRDLVPLTIPGPGPVTRRPDPVAFPELWTTDWTATEGAEGTLATRLSERLKDEGVTVTGLELVGATEAVLRIENDDYAAATPALGRALRAMAFVLPPSVERFRIVLEDGGLAVSETALDRSDFEALDGVADRHSALAAATTLGAPGPRGGSDLPGLYPRLTGSVAPYVATSFFDPDRPVRLDYGIAAKARFEPRPGLIFGGELRQKLGGDIDEGRASNSVLERVRTNAPLYAAADSVTIRHLTASYAAKLPGDFYGRATVGYLERMFGGVSGEVLWKPVESPLAFGLELNYVGQRDFDQLFGFQDYRVLTGHASAYYDFGNGFLGQLDVGRYLAGDTGATVTLTREFANGWQIGAFATVTNVSAEDFGEGSFDKGIRLRIPLQAITGRPSQRALSRTIRPTQRDGGARLSVEGRLYERVRAGGEGAIFADWGQVWR